MIKCFKEWQKEDKKFNQILSFENFIEVVEKNPTQQIRTSAQYIKDMFHYFGQESDGTFSLFLKEHPGSPPVRGQIKTQQQIYNAINNFVEEGYNNKLILLIGPNGSAKSSLVKKIMLATEDYSKSDEGELYTFSWIFPLENYTKGPLGLSNTHASGKGATYESYAFLEDREIAAILNSEFKDHPLLLFPIEQRRELIHELFKNKPKQLQTIKKTYLYNGDLSQRNKSIFDALLKNYKGNYLEVFKHIRVEKFYINKRYSSSAVTIEPQLHVDAQIHQITMDRRLASLPASLQSLNLFGHQGEVVLANRGILEFSDLFKRPLDTFKYLLTTMESRTINLQGILTELDIFFIGTSNELHFSAFKQHPDFNSFRGRFSFLKVPYLLNFALEQKIYNEQLEHLQEISHFEPHALEALCLWSVMTRLRRPMVPHYTDKRSGELFTKFSPLEKALFIAKDIFPERLESKEKQLLKKDKDELLNEFENDALYEGKFGISPREIKQIIYELATSNKVIGFTHVLDYLKELQEKKSEYDFLNISTQGDYHNSPRFLELLEKHILDIYDTEVRDSLGLVDNRSYEEYLEKYIMHVTALIKGEKLKNNITGKFETSDMYFIHEFENNLHLKENPQDFRSHMISRVGAYYLDHPGVKMVYTEMFGDIVKILQESFRSEQKKVIDKITKQLIVILDESKHGPDATSSTLNDESRQIFHRIMKNLKEKYRYSEQGALEMLHYLIQKRY